MYQENLPGKWQPGEEVVYLLVFEGEFLDGSTPETQVRRKLTSRLSETMSIPILDEWDEPLWESAQMENLIVLWFTRLAQIWDFSNRIHRSRDHFLETICRL